MIYFYTFELEEKSDLIEEKMRDAISKRYSMLDFHSSSKSPYVANSSKFFLGRESDNSLFGTRFRGGLFTWFPKLIFKISEDAQYKKVSVRFSLLSTIILVGFATIIIQLCLAYFRTEVPVFDLRAVSLLILAYLILAFFEYSLTKRTILKVVNKS